MMNELSVVIALLGGLIIGVFFFSGLWITIRRVEHMQRPGIILFASSMTRLVVALAGFYLLAWGRWERLLIAVIGFMLARMVMIRSLGYPEMPSYTKSEEMTSSHGTQS